MKANNGQLENPTTIAVLTDRGTQIQKDFFEERDGNALSSSLDQYTISLREITRSSGIWGLVERVDTSLRAVRELMDTCPAFLAARFCYGSSRAGALLSGVRIQLSSQQQNQIFANVVAFSNELQQSNVTLYSINPLGVDESLYRANYYQSFVKGVSTSSQTDLADLSLQVLAVHERRPGAKWQQ